MKLREIQGHLASRAEPAWSDLTVHALGMTLCCLSLQPRSGFSSHTLSLGTPSPATPSVLHHHCDVLAACSQGEVSVASQLPLTQRRREFIKRPRPAHMVQGKAEAPGLERLRISSRLWLAVAGTALLSGLDTAARIYVSACGHFGQDSSAGQARLTGPAGVLGLTLRKGGQDPWLKSLARFPMG